MTANSRSRPARVRVCSHLIATAAVLAAVAGCEPPTGVPANQQAAYVEAMLVAGADTQWVLAEWQQPGESLYTDRRDPVPPSLVDLILTPRGGAPVGLQPDPTTPGRFFASLTVGPGEQYTLDGTVNGLPVHGTTLVPDALLIAEPASDTIAVTISECHLVCHIPYHWAARGADAFLVEQGSPGTAASNLAALRDTVGTLDVLPASQISEITIMALDPGASAFLLPTTPRGNIGAVFGFIGAASVGHRVIRWR